jgi:hypothetical protein
MALIVSAATGNFNATATWVGGVVPTIDDEAQASTGHTVTITATTACNLVSNAGTGKFVLNSGVILTANVQHKGSTNATNCVEYSGTGANAKIIGNITSGTAFGRNAVNNTGAGTLEIQGNCVGGSDASAVVNSVGGSVIITGNLTGGSAATGYALSNSQIGSVTISGNATGSAISAINNASTGSITLHGNVIGGTAAGSAGVRNASTATSVTITGTCTGGTNATASGIINVLTGSVTLNGSAIGGTGTSAGPGVQNSSTGNVFITRAVGNGFGPGSTGISAAVGVANAGLGVVEIQALEYGTFGMSPTSGTGIRLKKSNSNVAVYKFCDSAGAKTLIDATANAAMPAATDVRIGVSYASGALSGSCAVPAAGSVALGVPVDATTGTAVLTPEAVWGAATRTLTAGAGISASDVWDYATRSLTTSSGPTAVQIRQEMDSNSTRLANLDATVSSRLAPSGTLAVVTTLTNAPTVPTAAAIATQVRSELSVELGRVDQAISSRATAGDIPTETEIAAEVWAKPTTELTITGSIGERAKNQSTVSTTGAQLAAALS